MGVGCGATSYKNGRWFSTLYTCNYGPNGNFINGQMYKQGPACSACGNGEQCSTSFPGLCESRKPSSPPRFNPPGRNTTSPEKLDKTTVATKKPITAPSRNIIPETTRKPIFSRKTTTTKRTTTTRRTTTSQRTTTRRPSTTKTTTKGSTTKRFRNSSKTKIITTTARSGNTGSEGRNYLFECIFDKQEESCIIRNKGKSWEQKQRVGNQYREVELFRKEKAEFFFTKLISPPSSKVACLDFRYKKFSTAGEKHVLTVLAWPNRGKPGKVSIHQDSPDASTWVRAQVTFKKVDRDFLLMLRALGPVSEGGSLILALDDVRVKRGRCTQ